MTIDIKDINHYKISMTGNEANALHDIETLKKMFGMFKDIAYQLAIDLRREDIPLAETVVTIEGERTKI